MNNRCELSRIFKYVANLEVNSCRVCPRSRMGSKGRGNRMAMENKADAIPMTSQESPTDKMIRLELPALRL